MRAYRVAYDGREFHGFQRQSNVRTIEGTLLDGLRALNVVDSGELPSGYAAAGRTDAGVSAIAQTIAFEAPSWLDPAAFNSELPPAIRIWADAAVPSSFHARHDPAAREYTYFQYAPERSGWVDERAAVAVNKLSGEHDFHNLTPDERGTVRDLNVTMNRTGAFVRLRIRADGFPRQLVRRLVTLVTDVACGDTDSSHVARLLGDETVSGPGGIGPAPAYPLVLTEVAYSDVAFQATPGARDPFEASHREAATMARVTGLLCGRED